jgi:hypothetical protein
MISDFQQPTLLDAPDTLEAPDEPHKLIQRPLSLTDFPISSLANRLRT